MACHNTLVIPSACAIGVVTPSSYSLNIMIGGHHGHDVLVISRGRGGYIIWWSQIWRLAMFMRLMRTILFVASSDAETMLLLMMMTVTMVMLLLISTLVFRLIKAWWQNRAAAKLHWWRETGFHILFVLSKVNLIPTWLTDWLSDDTGSRPNLHDLPTWLTFLTPTTPATSTTTTTSTATLLPYFLTSLLPYFLTSLLSYFLTSLPPYFLTSFLPSINKRHFLQFTLNRAVSQFLRCFLSKEKSTNLMIFSFPSHQFGQFDDFSFLRSLWWF